GLSVSGSAGRRRLDASLNGLCHLDALRSKLRPQIPLSERRVSRAQSDNNRQATAQVAIHSEIPLLSHKRRDSWLPHSPPGDSHVQEACRYLPNRFSCGTELLVGTSLLGKEHERATGVMLMWNVPKRPVYGSTVKNRIENCPKSAIS